MEKKLQHRVLIISNKPPYPIIDGGCYAMSKFEQLLRDEVSELNYFAISTQKHPFDEKSLPDYWKLNQNFFTGKIDTTVNPKHIARFLFGQSLRARRFYSNDIKDQLLKIITEKQIDLVIFESIYAAVYLDEIKKWDDLKTILRAHNVEHYIWEKYAGGLKGFKKRVMDSETTRLKEFEGKVWQQVNGLLFISDKEQEFYKVWMGKPNSVVIEIQMYPENNELTINPGKLKLFHIGAMDWLPNIEGVEDFVQNIFPVVQEKYPGIELHLAGKSMPDYFKKYESSHVKVHGQVDDAGAFMDDGDVSIVPVRSGGGIRIKVLESMAKGKPVISTSVGIEGIPAKNKEEFLLANTTREWIAAIGYLTDQSNYQSISSHAREFISRNYSEKALKEKLINFITTGIH